MKTLIKNTGPVPHNRKFKTTDVSKGSTVVRSVGEDSRVFRVEHSQGDLVSHLATVHGDSLCDEHGGSAKANALLFANSFSLLELVAEAYEEVKNDPKWHRWAELAEGILDQAEKSR